MREVTVKLDLNTIKDFNKKACDVTGDIDVVSGRYIVDGKSLLGLYSLDLSKNITVKINNVDEAETDRFIKEIENVIVK